jgi:hypothetical protein
LLRKSGEVFVRIRSADIWLGASRRYADLRETLVPMAAARATARLTVPFEPEAWLADRKARMTEGLKRLAKAVRTGTIPKGSIEDGTLRIERLTAAVPEDADELILDLYRRLPEVRITDILLEVEAATGFADAFTHLRTGAPCKVNASLIGVVKSSAIESSTCAADNIFSRPLLLSGIGVTALPPWDQKNDMVQSHLHATGAESRRDKRLHELISFTSAKDAFRHKAELCTYVV